MNDNNFVWVDDKPYLKMQSKDSREILGISKTQFYNDHVESSWSKEDGPRGAVFYYVPKDYVEKRQSELKKVQFTELNKSKPVETTSQEQQIPMESIGLSLLNDTVQKLLTEKDHRIQQLEEQLVREKEMHQQVIASKEQTIQAKDNEVNTLRGTVLFLTGGNDGKATHEKGRTIQYAPVNPNQMPFWSKVFFWKNKQS
jgi:hypothetical protein